MKSSTIDWSNFTAIGCTITKYSKIETLSRTRTTTVSNIRRNVGTLAWKRLVKETSDNKK